MDDGALVTLGLALFDAEAEPDCEAETDVAVDEALVGLTDEGGGDVVGAEEDSAEVGAAEDVKEGVEEEEGEDEEGGGGGVVGVTEEAADGSRMDWAAEFGSAMVAGGVGNG